MNSHTWAEIRAQGAAVPLTSLVGGISLALRHARMVARVGWTGVRFLVDDENERSALQEQFRRKPAPTRVQIELVSTAEAGKASTAIPLEAAAIYLKDSLLEGRLAQPQPDFRITSPAELRSAQSFLFAQIRKSVVLDGVISFYVMRPLARIFTRALLNTPVSPNQATLGALACGIGAALCAAMGSAYYAIFAGILYWFGGVLDCIDGELARMRLQSSKIGEWLDSMVDEFSTIALIAGLGIGLSRDGAGDHWMPLGLAGAVLAIITLAPLYADLHRKKLAIDTAQFPWFFDDKSKTAVESEPSAVAKVINFAGYFIRRDANLTATAIFLILNLRAEALTIMLCAFVAVSLLTLTHYIVMRSRRAAGALSD